MTATFLRPLILAAVCLFGASRASAEELVLDCEGAFWKFDLGNSRAYARLDDGRWLFAGSAQITDQYIRWNAPVPTGAPSVLYVLDRLTGFITYYPGPNDDSSRRHCKKARKGF